MLVGTSVKMLIMWCAFWCCMLVLVWCCLAFFGAGLVVFGACLVLIGAGLVLVSGDLCHLVFVAWFCLVLFGIVWCCWVLLGAIGTIGYRWVLLFGYRCGLGC